ncbi:MAG: c(7)-type cytochrome triheme domain-containing protein [Nitrospirota bacterium]
MMNIKKRGRRKIIFISIFLFLFTVIIMSAISVSKAEYGDLTLNHYAEEAGMPPVVFPHWFHRIRFTCKVCHPSIFEMRQGANDINMIKIIKGQFCGRCHNGRIAWPPLYCDRCHAGKSKIKIPRARGFLR